METFQLEGRDTELGWCETLIGGQSFAWTVDPVDPRRFLGVVQGRRAALRVDAERGVLECQSDGISRAQWEHYLALDGAHEAELDRLPWRSDAVLGCALEAFRGLRIMRQPVEEVLFCFLCSSAKSIIQIRQLRNAACAEFGEDLGEGVYAFPDWSAIHAAGEGRLRALKLGYRARYVAAVAAQAEDGFFESLRAAGYADAKAQLMALPGIGEKIADCVCLFGLGHLQAFPVDTWIAKIMAELYGLEDWSHGDIAHFGRVHFGPGAGLAQQYLFSRARAFLT